MEKTWNKAFLKNFVAAAPVVALVVAGGQLIDLSTGRHDENNLALLVGRHSSCLPNKTVALYYIKPYEAIVRSS